MTDNDIVYVTCYGTTTVTTRKEATKTYLEGLMCSEGSEHNRYANIIAGLLAGDTHISDED